MTDTAADAIAGFTAFRTCPLCEATCGLEIEIRDGGAIGRIRGDRDDVFSHGFICPKGSTLKQLHEDPDRVRTPLVRRNGKLEPATWDEAFAEVERRLTTIVEQHGRDAVAIYLGNPNVHNLAGLIYNRALVRGLGTRNVYSASTVDQRPKEVSTGLMFGSMLSFVVPGGRPRAFDVAARLRLFTRATSLGGPESLVEHRASVEGAASRAPEGLLRLSIGLEHPDDLIADLRRALGD